jgi:multiple sugar transport system substrate-binding protein
MWEESIMKRILSVVLTLALVLGLVSVASAADCTINVNIWDSNQQAGLQEIADDWTKISGVPVKIEVVNWDSYWTLLAAGAQGGEMPDVFWTHSTTVQMYMDNDLLLKLYVGQVQDLSISDPDLEEIFRHYYEKEGDGHDHSEA